MRKSLNKHQTLFYSCLCFFPCNQVPTLCSVSNLTPPCPGFCPKYLPHHVLFSQPGPCFSPARPRPGSPPICCPSPREITPAHIDTHSPPLASCASPHVPQPCPFPTPTTCLCFYMPPASVFLHRGPHPLAYVLPTSWRWQVWPAES